VVLGILILICVALVVMQPHLTLWLVLAFGVAAADLVVGAWLRSQHSSLRWRWLTQLH
jgi:hypothetical protein